MDKNKLTLGERRLGIDFSTPENGNAYKIQSITAELINLLDSLPQGEGERLRLRNLAMNAFQEATYWSVEAVRA